MIENGCYYYRISVKLNSKRQNPVAFLSFYSTLYAGKLVENEIKIELGNLTAKEKDLTQECGC